MSDPCSAVLGERGGHIKAYQPILWIELEPSDSFSEGSGVLRRVFYVPIQWGLRSMIALLQDHTKRNQWLRLWVSLDIPLYVPLVNHTYGGDWSTLASVDLKVCHQYSHILEALQMFSYLMISPYCWIMVQHFVPSIS